MHMCWGSIAMSSVWNFTGLMQMIHIPIGLVEGIVTAAVVVAAKFASSKKLSYFLSITAVILAGVISPYASQKPDGLEWSLLNISDSVVMQTQGLLYEFSQTVQAKSAIFTGMPYTFGAIAGLFAVAAIMFATGMLLSRKMVSENVQ